jgi:hypothetical protein
VLERQPLAYEVMRKTRGSYSEVEDRMETVRVIYHHEGDGWWAREDAVLEHFVPVGERVAA